MSMRQAATLASLAEAGTDGTGPAHALPPALHSLCVSGVEIRHSVPPASGMRDAVQPSLTSVCEPVGGCSACCYMHSLNGFKICAIRFMVNAWQAPEFSCTCVSLWCTVLRASGMCVAHAQQA